MTDKLLKPSDPRTELRSILRTDGGRSAEEVSEMSDVDVWHAMAGLEAARRRKPKVEALLRHRITEGALLAEDVAQWTDGEKLDYYFAEDKLRGYRAVASAGIPPALLAAPPSPEGLSRTEAAALVADLVAVVAGQQAQIDELRDELARERNAKLALFGQQKVIDQLTRVPRDFKGFEALIELEEEASQVSSDTNSMESKVEATVANARDTRAALKFLSQHVGSLDAGRKVNVDEMNRAIERMNESAKRQARVRTKGKVHIKIGEVSGGKRSEGG